jgi:hypothetical protein
MGKLLGPILRMILRMILGMSVRWFKVNFKTSFGRFSDQFWANFESVFLGWFQTDLGPILMPSLG